jgi:hypothetical protein
VGKFSSIVVHGPRRAGRLSRRHGKIRLPCLALLIEFALYAEYPSLIGLMIRVHVIASPQRLSIVVLLALALYTAFPCADYYASSALDTAPLRPSRLAQFRAGRTVRVPVFRSSTCVWLGGVLYPWRCGERACWSLSRPGRVIVRVLQQGELSPAASDRFSPTPSRLLGA